AGDKGHQVEYQNMKENRIKDTVMRRKNSREFIVERQISASVFYSIFLHILIFYLVAFISGYLAEHLKARDRQLANTSRELRKARLETDDILRNLNSGLLTIDAGGYILFYNRSAERILGYREEDVKGMRCDEVFAERMPNLALTLMDSLSNREQHPRKEIEILNAKDTIIPLGLSTSPLMEDEGTLRGLIAIFSDLTDAKLLEAKVRAADRLAAVGEMSASIAHEIRNPLAAISGSVEVLDSELHFEGENARLMQLIVKESHRLSRILSEFLLYARIDRPIYNKVELCHLVNEVIRILHHHPAFRENMKIDVEADESIIYVVGDEDLIKQLLLNLAVNACEEFETKGDQLTFRIAANPACGTVELYVQDNGPGISPENMKKIYEPFFSTKKQGTGLGLAIVHRVCTALQLNVSIDSQLSEGTTFMIEFEICKSDKIDPSAIDSGVISSPTAKA
ncbi:MAG: ATP-binding protein, partial [candidate division Zixibacteria bacterium]|nr:ATP-binding protein [candidate division Zixibacteria bacterium]